jgi:N-methylhydantoinase A/oxoprolinase/acetone carboxylase beta subunit
MMDNLPNFHQKLGLGIDTGGTFTDGVILDLDNRRVVRTTKVLTTHQDLCICIAEVLNRLTPENSPGIAFVSLSTTLATNAIAEGKRRPVGLFLLGYDPDLVARYQFQNQFGTAHFAYIAGRHGLDGKEEIPLDQSRISHLAEVLRSKVDTFAVASYAGPINAAYEQIAAEILAQRTELPVVQSHHLSNDLDSIRRATTASLNASLLGNLQEFLDAVQQMLHQHGIHAPILMVRGDGSIVRAEFARSRPVEIIHSGPATSTIGGQFLAGVDTCLVVDIGGTTTDIALVNQGNAQMFEKAATVGNYRTCVKTIQTRSFGLGGDSQIHFDRTGSLSLGPDRVLPLTHLCVQFPSAREDLARLLEEKRVIHYNDELEYWILRREPRRPFQDDRTNRALQLLREGPLRLSRLLQLTRVKSPVLLDVFELINQEIIERASLTPTDLLHLTGEYTPWDTHMADRVIQAVARNWNQSSEAFIQQVRNEITRRIVSEVVEFLSGRQISEPAYHFSKDRLDRWLFEESFHPSHPFLGCQISLKIPLVGIGAPAQAFLPPVAQALNTTIILPEHYAVANAVGTVVGNILVRREADILPCIEGAAITGYFARVDGKQPKFELIEQAVAFARQSLVAMVSEEARLAGLTQPEVEIFEGENNHGMVHLSAWAIGKPNGSTV